MSTGKPRARSAIEMLQRSHDRLRERLAELRAAAAALEHGTATAHAIAVALDVSDHLDRSVTRHEADEERSVFPHLCGHRALGSLLRSIETEHREHEQLHARLRQLVRRWHDRSPTRDEAQKLADLAQRLQRSYNRHMEREETELFPVLHTLPPATLAAIRDDMRARRGK